MLQGTEMMLKCKKIMRHAAKMTVRAYVMEAQSHHCGVYDIRYMMPSFYAARRSRCLLRSDARRYYCYMVVTAAAANMSPLLMPER